MNNDEGWWFQAVEGFCRLTDQWTNKWTFRNVQSLLQLKIDKINKAENISVKLPITERTNVAGSHECLNIWAIEILVAQWDIISNISLIKPRLIL